MLVGALVVFLALGVIQLALVLHVRNTLMACASEGAHVGALADRDTDDAEARAGALARGALGRDVVVRAEETETAGAVVLEVTVTTPGPALGLWGAGTISVTAHAIEESPRA